MDLVYNVSTRKLWGGGVAGRPEREADNLTAIAR
jgi:hypothetical protein